jgi:DNA polymerase delta subunit 4
MSTGRLSSTFAQSRSGAQPAPPKRSAKAAPPAAAARGTEAPREADSDEADEAALRQFDLASAFGPVSGVTRLQRWERAHNLGLAPPEGVKSILLKHGSDSEFNLHLFEEGKV